LSIAIWVKFKTMLYLLAGLVAIAIIAFRWRTMFPDPETGRYRRDQWLTLLALALVAAMFGSVDYVVNGRPRTLIILLLAWPLTGWIAWMTLRER
jgi:hypothetical protein